MYIKNKFQRFISILFMAALLLSSVQPSAAVAQGSDGLLREVNAESGKVSFLKPESGRVLSASRALGTFIRPQDPAMALVQRYAPEFGIQHPERDLTEIKKNQTADGRQSVRYQQNYQGIPVLGGELMVNTNGDGDLYSINGEVSPNLALATQPKIGSAQATQTALQAVAKWYEKSAEDFVASEPELWIYDESLLKPSNRPVELVWRLEVTPKDSGRPVRELVLVHAERGSISLHFNQMDTAWAWNSQPQEVDQPVANSTAENLNIPARQSTPHYTMALMPALTGVTWYVATTGHDSNSCSAPASPCATINGALGKAASGDTIYVAIGIYTAASSPVVNITKSITLSGGWDSSFVLQTGFSVVDGGGVNSGINVSSLQDVTISNFVVKNSLIGIGTNGGNLSFERGALIDNRNGIYNYGITTFTNATISGNDAYCCLAGSAISNPSGVVKLLYSTIANNTGVTEAIWSLNGDAVIEIGDSLLVDNPNCSANLISDGHNIFSSSSICYGSVTLQPSDQVGVDPRLLPLADGGFHPLGSGSPALDAASATCPLTDQRGQIRPEGAGCDIGAFEGSVPLAPVVRTYTSFTTSTLPGILLCTQIQPNCTNGSNPHADAAHKYAIGTYNFYANNFLRDSIDNNGLFIESSVHYCPNTCPYNNAFWNGEQIVYGAASGFPLADDVVAHELTHGVTQYESNLFYYYQAGAINESFSDVFGEYYDQWNGLGNDAPNVRWLLGEDVSGLGALRSMSNPPAYSDPDKMSSPYYYEGEDDNGGVHANSGVNSKAVYLMVDGGTFNGRTVTSLGWEKVGAIYYEVNTNLLISGSDYSDLYYALQQACNNLIGQHGITAGDCPEVKDAVDAVEMNGQPATNFNSEAPLCDVGNPLSTVFFDDLEAGMGNWSTDDPLGYSRWRYDSPYGSYAHSGLHFLYADDYPAAVTSSYVRMKYSIPILAANSFLRFDHAFGFENDGTTYYDGGVLEYSQNSGGTWQDAGWLFVNNGYRGTIYNGQYADNPLAGRWGFVSDSHGYISSRLSLQPLYPSLVMFRWRMGLDSSVVDWGWWLDDIHVYTCQAPTFGDVPFSHPYSSDIEILYANGYTGGCSTSPLLYCPDVIMNRAQAAVFMLRGNFGSNYVPVTPTHFFQDSWVNTAWAEGWAESMFLEGLSGGCSSSPLLFCPEEQLTNVQAAVFGLRLKYGTSYLPPAASGTIFADLGNANYWGTAWAEKAYADGLIPACGTSGGKPMFCPTNLVSRGFGASMIVKAKGLTMPP